MVGKECSVSWLGGDYTGVYICLNSSNYTKNLCVILYVDDASKHDF